ncbi:cartilage matrix protein [Lingula anatina]|uniref:Cartilage matrix protein n=1 Tax=Lingula anatina TaxID=7574 RepID=A0A1S3JHF4_LINAN|nr:cartilage matrix protein [Lingula anatina]XP_013409330.1 cartilage matrix protein [Lingula anatina]|eukprot:XP_013409329.1 cartilage matrix protein [Lingula anatina]
MKLSALLLVAMATVVAERWVVEARRYKTYICGQPADIVFVIDGSRSIWPVDFKERMIGFLKSFIKEFNIQDDGSGTRIGAMVFSSDTPYQTKIEFNLKDHFSRESLNKAIDKIQQTKGQTRTDIALQIVREQMFTRENGARIGEVPQIAIVLTDGNSDFEEKTAKQAALTKAKGIKVFAIGIGKVDEKELKVIATGPDEVITVGDFSALAGIKRELSIKTCEIKPPCVITTDCGDDLQTDVTFVLSESVTTTPGTTTESIELIRNITSKFNIGKDEIQVSLVPVTRPGPGFYFKDYSDYDGIDGHLEKFEARIKVLETTGARIRAMTDMLYDQKNGARPGVRKLGIIILDGASANVRKTMAAASAAYNRGVEMVAIGIGDSVNLKELRSIGRNSRRVIRLPDYESFNGLKRTLFYRITCKGRTEPDPDDICDPGDEEEK